ncbi:hypothetical protein CAOG_02758 [Capsaspora owczarzaki ATCC 30864]|uniref:Uncharacterized protein n=1 Tax=Capsaspora owczarzaki (strain ATCC 30864) TaxID=595528 RepID=A0A0D2X1Z1_CAPO3|nr:hypothetical protein CAOG_02758 [Capsaspora owczarzaki ATCC 30864]KJE91649.1 hypothetical protein CAOG_002758 [Capsaspora owczarzaki ATCC 30864]|eukprot:XP_004349508.1 hypothetical protein CAOG_02758 [Capsaspora owczarzaki ATCC 30864]
MDAPFFAAAVIQSALQSPVIAIELAILATLCWLIAVAWRRHAQTIATIYHSYSTSMNAAAANANPSAAAAAGNNTALGQSDSAETAALLREDSLPSRPAAKSSSIVSSNSAPANAPPRTPVATKTGSQHHHHAGAHPYPGSIDPSDAFFILTPHTKRIEDMVKKER